MNHAVSSGLTASVGASVVGRSTPGSETSAPTRELTSVDLPAPVDREQRGVERQQPWQQVVVQLPRQLGQRASVGLHITDGQREQIGGEQAPQ
jgi:hypothetical protein